MGLSFELKLTLSSIIRQYPYYEVLVMHAVKGLGLGLGLGTRGAPYDRALSVLNQPQLHATLARGADTGVFGLRVA